MTLVADQFHSFAREGVFPLTRGAVSACPRPCWFELREILLSRAFNYSRQSFAWAAALVFFSFPVLLLVSDEIFQPRKAKRKGHNLGIPKDSARWNRGNEADAGNVLKIFFKGLC